MLAKYGTMTSQVTSCALGIPPFALVAGLLKLSAKVKLGCNASRPFREPCAYIPMLNEAMYPSSPFGPDFGMNTAPLAAGVFATFHRGAADTLNGGSP